MSSVSIDTKRPVEALLRLAAPLAIAQIISVSIMTADFWKMAQLSAFDLAAGSLAIRYYQPFYFFGLGLLAVISPLTAQALGGRDERGVRRTFRQGLVIALGLGFLFYWPVYFGYYALPFLGQDDAVARYAASFLFYSALTLPIFFVFLVMRFFTIAMGQPMLQLYATLLTLGLNIILNELLADGYGPIPALGIEGVAIATLLSYLAANLYFLHRIHYSPAFSGFNLLSRLWVMDWQMTKRQLRIGFPNGINVMSETGMFAVAGLLMGVFGTAALAASAITNQIAATTYMIPLSIAQATAIMVGHAAGANSLQKVEMTGRTSLWTGFWLSVLMMIIVYVWRQPLLELFIRADDPLFDETLAVCLPLMIITALFQIPDGIQAVQTALLRGLNDTTIPAVIALVNFWGVGIGSAVIFGFLLGFGPAGIWAGITAGLTANWLALGWRWNWRVKQMRLGASLLAK